MTHDLDVALAAAAAGAAELAAHYRPGGVRHTAVAKDLPRSLVTAADLAAERAVLGVIRAEFEGDTIVSEESSADTVAGRRTWYVDPLDGTTNFAHGIPLFCVSVGLLVDGRPTVGVVHAPLLRELWAAAAGEGTTLNGEKVSVSATSDLRDALLTTGFPYDPERRSGNNLDNFARMMLASRAVRRGGSAALDLAWVAGGRFDGYWELSLGPWDSPAGVVLVREAGGRVTDLTGGDSWLGRHILATNGRIHAALQGSVSLPSAAPN